MMNRGHPSLSSLWTPLCTYNTKIGAEGSFEPFGLWLQQFQLFFNVDIHCNNSATAATGVSGHSGDPLLVTRFGDILYYIFFTLTCWNLLEQHFASNSSSMRNCTNWKLTFWRGNPAVTNHTRDDLIEIYAQLPHTIANDLNHSVFTNWQISNGRSVIKVTDS